MQLVVKLGVGEKMENEVENTVEETQDNNAQNGETMKNTTNWQLYNSTDSDKKQKRTCEMEID